MDISMLKGCSTCMRLLSSEMLMWWRWGLHLRQPRIYRGSELREKRSPSRETRAEFLLTDEIREGEYHISYVVKQEGNERQYKTPNFHIMKK